MNQNLINVARQYRDSHRNMNAVEVDQVLEAARFYLPAVEEKDLREKLVAIADQDDKYHAEQSAKREEKAIKDYIAANKISVRKRSDILPAADHWEVSINGVAKVYRKGDIEEYQRIDSTPENQRCRAAILRLISEEK